MKTSKIKKENLYRRQNAFYSNKFRFKGYTTGFYTTIRSTL